MLSSSSLSIPSSYLFLAQLLNLFVRSLLIYWHFAYPLNVCITTTSSSKPNEKTFRPSIYCEDSQYWIWQYQYRCQQLVYVWSREWLANNFTRFFFSLLLYEHWSKTFTNCAWGFFFYSNLLQSFHNENEKFPFSSLQKQISWWFHNARTNWILHWKKDTAANTTHIHLFTLISSSSNSNSSLMATCISQQKKYSVDEKCTWAKMGIMTKW